MPRRPRPPPVTLEEILRADPRALALLATSDREAWRCLVAHMRSSAACPAELLRALLAIDDFDGWLRRVFTAYCGLHPDDGMDADHELRRWLSAGIARTFPATDLLALEMRYREALDHAGADAAERARELAVDIARAHEGSPLLGHAYLLLARRLSEDLDQNAAIAASRSAEDVFARLGDEVWRAQAVRMRGAALLRARRIDEALAVLDTVGDAPSTSFVSKGPHRYHGVVLGSDGHYHPERVLDPIDDVLYRAGGVALWAPRTQFEWLRTLDAIARATGHRECAVRAAAGGRDDGDFDEDLLLPGPMR